MLDSLITGGTVVTATGRFNASVGVSGERIAGLYLPGTEPAADTVIDASGLLVMPGLVDMHSHHREPGFEHKDTIATVTGACAAGGVTTSVAMPNVAPPPNSAVRLQAMMERYRASAVVDWNINAAATQISEIPEMATMGIAAFKVFMVVDTGRDYPHMPGTGVHDHGELFEIMQACAAAGVPLMVHPHDQALMSRIEQAFWDRGEHDAIAYAKAYAAHGGVVWESAIGTLLRLQKATGVHLHLLHVQTAGSVEMIRRAKDAGQRVTCEINPWALFLGNKWENIERLGSYALSYWVPEENVSALWSGLADGTIDIVATDHAPHTREEKELGWKDGWKAHTGTPSTQFYLRMLLDAAHRGQLPLERVVAACSTSPADLFALADKGRIEVGRHADIVLVDPDRSSTISDDEVLSLSPWSPYSGQTYRGLPVRTLVRGRTVFENNTVVGTTGFGHQAIATRTAL